MENIDNRQEKWSEVERRTQKVGTVKEAVHLLDVCWHDVDVCQRFFMDHNAQDGRLFSAIDALKKITGEISDKYGQWLSTEETKLKALMNELQEE